MNFHTESGEDKGAERPATYAAQRTDVGLAPAPRAPSSLRALGLVGAAFTALAALVLLTGDGATSRFGQAVMLGAGALIGLLGVAMSALWAAARWRRQRAEAAFATLLASEATPAALTDMKAGVLAASAGLGATAAPPRGGRMAARPALASLIAAEVADADAIVYRLLNAAARDGAASETAAGPQGNRRVSARLLTDGRVLWRIEVAAAPAAGGPPPDALIDRLPVAVARLDLAGNILFVNVAGRMLLGAAAQPGVRIEALLEGLGKPLAARVAEAVRGDGSGRPEIARVQTGEGEAFLQVSMTRAEFDAGPCVIAVLADATELKSLEAQFVQSQKMQAVGQLAGGVAHDFNNLLTAISGHTDLLLQRHENDDLDYADLHQIRQNANRAAGLVRQLLAYSRKQTLRPTVVRLRDALTETSHLLNRLLGEKHSLRMEHAEDLWHVKVDTRQFEQVIMNLVVNARDAMPGGGGVLVRTSNERLQRETRRGRAIMARGDYVRIDVIDSGEGIAEDKIEQVFEPFFTTKKSGEGTGLGLSTVYGIVKQTGGFIFVDSAPEQGATFTIYLPRHVPDQEDLAAPATGPAAQQDLTGSGLVLLIEDETSVRSFAARALKLRGYRVVEAASGEEALEILEDDALSVDVIVSDVVMPRMDGPTCVAEARRKRPKVKVIFMSGYAEDSLRREMDDVGDCEFLAKPFSLAALTAKVKEVLAD